MSIYISDSRVETRTPIQIGFQSGAEYDPIAPDAETNGIAIYADFSDKNRFEAGVGSDLIIHVYVRKDHLKGHALLLLNGEDINDSEPGSQLKEKIQIFVRELKELDAFREDPIAVSKARENAA